MPAVDGVFANNFILRKDFQQTWKKKHACRIIYIRWQKAPCRHKGREDDKLRIYTIRSIKTGIKIRCIALAGLRNFRQIKIKSAVPTLTLQPPCKKRDNFSALGTQIFNKLSNNFTAYLFNYGAREMARKSQKGKCDRRAANLKEFQNFCGS